MKTDQEIYKDWYSSTKDLRYLRPRRWNQLKSLIQSQQLKSVLEFGSGVSTLLFLNLGMKVFSAETDEKFIKFCRKKCDNEAVFIHWDNMNLHLPISFDLGFVDGILPRTDQLRVALKHAPFIAIDDFENRIKYSCLPMLENCKRLDDESTTLAIFKQRNYARIADNSKYSLLVA